MCIEILLWSTGVLFSARFHHCLSSLPLGTADWLKLLGFVIVVTSGNDKGREQAVSLLFAHSASPLGGGSLRLDVSLALGGSWSVLYNKKKKKIKGRGGEATAALVMYF